MAKTDKNTIEKNNAPEKGGRSVVPLQFAFERINYILMIVGVVTILLGFLLMTGGGSEDPNVFNEAMFGFRRLTMAPLLILAGFVIELFAILKKPKA